jgi:hypothetical protein
MEILLRQLGTYSQNRLLGLQVSKDFQLNIRDCTKKLVHHI